jgi:hypothetical protein
MASPRELQLAPDFIPDAALATSARQRPRQATLTVPDGVSYLSLGEAGELQIAPAATPEQSDGRQLLLEPIGTGQPQLLLVWPAGEQVLVNGKAAPQLCVLGERDHFQFGDDHVLHVVVYNRPKIGPPSAGSVGKECPVCRTILNADTRVYACVKCGTEIHLEEDETPSETQLECALLVSQCPACAAPIEWVAGYAWQPELYSG